MVTSLDTQANQLFRQEIIVAGAGALGGDGWERGGGGLRNTFREK